MKDRSATRRMVMALLAIAAAVPVAAGVDAAAPPSSTDAPPASTDAPSASTDAPPASTDAPPASTEAPEDGTPTSIDEAITPLTDDPGGPLLFKLDYWLNRPTDNLIALVGGASRYTGVRQTGGYHAKYRWIDQFDSVDDEMVWTVELSETTTFNVRVSVGSEPGDEFVLDVVDTPNSLTFGPSEPAVSALLADDSMDLLEPGTITIPAGRHELRLRKSQTDGFDSTFKAIELIRSSDYAAYQQRVADFRVDTSWLQGKHGYMVQWGGWSYPRWGPKGSWQDVWNGFDVDLFADEMVKAKVDYVLWSVTWTDYLFPAPIQSIDDIMGPSEDRTADRDLLMEIALALQARGIDLTVYYHVGHSEQFSVPWWTQQNWPTATFKRNAYGDRSTFFSNWKRIIGEVGQRYGTLIKGFFFDDGLAYYPADFEELGAVARTGNPDRFISYNPFIAARYTDFQDVNFGERNCVGPTDFDGRLLDGPHAGLFQHCMFLVHRDWGSWTQDWVNPGVVRTPEKYHETYGRATEQGATSVANMMFNGPTFVDRYPPDNPKDPPSKGELGDGNANMGLAAEIPNRYVSNIAVDINGELYSTLDGRLYTTDQWNRWKRARAPEADSYGIQRAAWFYTLDEGNLFRVGRTGRSTPLGNDGFDIATISVGADGSVYGLTATGDMIRWTLGSWQLMPTRMTGLTAISVGSSWRNVWFLDADGKPHHFNGRSVSSYSTIDMTFTSIEAATNGDMFAIDTDGGLWTYRRRVWTELTDIGPVSEVTATSHDDFYFIRADNQWIGHFDGSDTITSVRSVVR